MKLLITICARGGSKGVKNKNIKLLNNKPLIEYSIKQAILFKQRVPNTTIILSTDSDKIIDTVNALETEIDTTYKRPDFLAQDNSGKLDAIKDVLLSFENLNQISYDYIIDLDVTAPLRTVDELFKALNLLKNSEAENIFSVNKAHKNPYFNMVEIKKDGYVALCKEGEFLSRQTAPTVYEMNASFYIYKRSFFNHNSKTVIGNKSLYYCMNHICFDIDTPIDFEFMEYLIANNKLDFKID